MNAPTGVAVDPAAGRVYWASFLGNKISFANRDGSGGGDLTTTGATSTHPVFPIMLQAPLGAGVPVLSGGTLAGTTLSCSQGTWTPDLLASFDYRAPQSFAFGWSENGTTIVGVTASSMTAGSPGSYACQVTASNQTGSALQSSAAFTVNAAAGGTGGADGTVGGGGSVNAPIVSRLRLAPAAFSAAASGARVSTASAGKKRSRPGATVSYTLDIAATVRFAVQQQVPGRTQGSGSKTSCVGQNKGNRKAHKCMRTVILGTFTQTGKRGTNPFHFSGRLSNRKLVPGTYKLVATATASSRTGRPVTVSFRSSANRRGPADLRGLCRLRGGSADDGESTDGRGTGSPDGADSGTGGREPQRAKRRCFRG